MTTPLSPLTGLNVDPTSESLLLEGLQFGLRRTGALGESFARGDSSGDAVTLTSGQTSYVALTLRAGTKVSNITVFCTTAAGTPTHSVAGLYSSALAQVATSADLVAAGFTASNAEQVFAMTTPYTVPSDAVYYIGVSSSGTTAASLAGQASIPALNLLAPTTAFQDTTAVTNALPATATKSSGGSLIYAYVS